MLLHVVDQTGVNHKDDQMLDEEPAQRAGRMRINATLRITVCVRLSIKILSIILAAHGQRSVNVMI